MKYNYNHLKYKCTLSDILVHYILWQFWQAALIVTLRGKAIYFMRPYYQVSGMLEERYDV